jgi:hypothetical protein
MKENNTHLLTFVCSTHFLLFRDGITLSNEENQAKFRLAGIHNDVGCLDASVSPWQASSASRTPMFSTCEGHAKQVS